jgi:hypothetical protein
MELSRRDALAALAAGGAAVGVGTLLGSEDGGGHGPDEANRTASEAPDRSNGATSLTDHERDTLLATADVVYPSVVDGVGTFVETYLDGLVTERPAYADGAGRAIARLDGMGREWYDGRFVDLDPDVRGKLLRETGADTAEADPEGSPAERIRYYLINELLYALYTSPTGGELVGIENPQGHPGGHASYQRGPEP